MKSILKYLKNIIILVRKYEDSISYFYLNTKVNTFDAVLYKDK